MAQQTATASVSNAEIKKKKRPEQARNGIAEWAVTILLLLFGTTTLVQAFVIPTGSMEDTLLIGDHLLVDKLAYAPAGPVSKHLLPYEEPQHGSIIVFRFPGDISQTFVKRVIGVPGDHIRLANRTVYRNGTPLYEPYVYHKSAYGSSSDNFPGAFIPVPQYPKAELSQQDMLEHHVTNGEVVVPPNSYFAMGDNRDNSSDSRYWGFVPRENIVGTPLIIYWSFEAPTEDLTNPNIGVDHLVDIVTHFFTKTRWSREFKLIHGYPLQ